MNKIKLICVLCFLVFGVAALFLDNGLVPTVQSSASGPNPGLTGAPGEQNCSLCHDDPPGPGTISITAPANYVPGQTYQIQVQHATTDATRMRWGFQATALDGTNAAAGTFTDTTAFTQQDFGDGRFYIEHNQVGTFAGTSNGATWTFDWNAPATNVGPVTFYTAGNQANNNNNPNLDQTFLTTTVSQPAGPTPTDTPTNTPTATPTPNECDFCSIQFPSSFTVNGGATTPSIYGQIYELGVTPDAGAPITAQVGWGPLLTDPRSAGGWTYFPAPFNAEVGDNNEYGGTMTAPVVGSTTQFSYVYRYSFDGGASWSYGDLDGAGSNPGLSFDVNQLGTMTVVEFGGTVVINTNDSGAGSLRDVIANAPTGATITFDLGPGPNTIGLSTILGLTINKNLTISGPGADVLEVARVGGPSYRIFTILAGNTVTIEGLTIRNGQDLALPPSGGGGAIANQHSTVTVRRCAFVQNAGSRGGAIINNGGDGGPTATLDVIESTLDGNVSSGAGGAIYNRGVVGGNAVVRISNSTFSGNDAGVTGGILYNDGDQGQAHMTVTNSTFSSNGGTTIINAAINGGIANLTIGNTILNVAMNSNISNGFGTITSLGYNIANDNGDGFLTSTGDQINTNPLLGPLQINGGTTMTHAPLPSSPALDRGKDIGPISPGYNPTGQDQRGSTRPVTYDVAITPPSGGDRSDIGAVELTASAPASISGTITYGNAIGNPVPPRFVKNVSLSSTAGSPAVGPIITGTPGTYALTGFGAGSYTIKPTKPGGATTAITSNDAARVAQGVSGSLAFVSQNQRFAADVTGNGNISSQDAAKIAQFVAGLPFSPPNLTGQWKFFVTGAPSPLPTPPQVYDDSRTYASVTSNLTGEDYVGILVGEASGNWNPATHPRTVNNGQWTVDSKDGGAKEMPITVAVKDVVTVEEKEIVVPVNVAGVIGKDIISYEFDLRYDPAVIQPMKNPVNLAKTVSRGLFVVTNPYEPGLLRVVVYGPMPIDGDGVLLNLRFTAIGETGSVSPLTFERIMFNEGLPGVTVTDGKIELF